MGQEKEELVSIIVPTYNVERYIKACLDSLLNQSYKEIEILIVDDGSTDKTPEICDLYEKKDNRIRIFHIEHKGVAVARNVGVEESKGKYCTFVDSDDFVSREFVSTLLDGIINYDADVSIVKVLDVKEDANIVDFDNYNDEVVFHYVDKINVAKSTLNDDEINCGVCNKLFKKSIFDGIKFPNGKVLEDVATFYKLIDKTNKIVITDSIRYFYRIRKGSITHSINIPLYTDKIQIEKERYEFYENKYPNLLENNLHYYKALLECYPYISKEYKKIVKEDFKNIYPRVKNYLDTKDKIKIFVFGLL